MLDQCSVGEGLSRAIARADELRKISSRKLRVRVVTHHGDLDPGVIIVATIAAKTGPELEAMQGKGVRHVPLAELDARAHELVRLVDDAAAEIEAAIAAAPPPTARPSQNEADFDTDAFHVLVESSYRAMLEAAGPLSAAVKSNLSNGGAAEAVALAALKVGALAGLGARIELEDLVEMLRSEFRDMQDRLPVPPAHSALH